MFGILKDPLDPGALAGTGRGVGELWPLLQEMEALLPDRPRL